MARDAYVQGVTEAFNEIPEPGEWLRRQAVAASRQSEQAIELAEHVRAATELVVHTLAVSAKNLPLSRALMEPVEQVLGFASQVQRMQQELVGYSEA
jgi:predicted hydrolase (HD superfamily)